MVGSYPVIVTNPSPGGGASNTATFTVAPAIPSGATVLVVGGQTAASMPLTSGELFASSAFASAGNLSVARHRPAASLISSGAAVLITGGSDASGAALATAETYQVAARTFATVTLSMKCAHKGHTATILVNGQVLIAGRDGTTTTACAELYDPSTATFTRTGDMTTPLSDHAAVLLTSGKVLIVGGSIDATGCTSCTSARTAEIYDPVTGKFTATTHPLNAARSSPTATLLSSGKVLITGGGVTPTGGPLKTAELYDPMTDTFTPTNNMSLERQFHTATLLSSGKVLVAGGLTKAGSVATATADLYDPNTNLFRATGAMMSTRLYHTATALGNGLVLIVGGAMQPANGTGETSAEIYDPASGVFTLTGPLATGRYGAAASALQ
jgi:large repetitive protein